MAKETKPIQPTVRQVATPSIQPIMYSHSDGRVWLLDKNTGKKTLMLLSAAQSQTRRNRTRYEILP